MTTKSSIPVSASEKTRKAEGAEVLEEELSSGVYHVLLFGMYISTALYALGIVLEFLHPHAVPLTESAVKSYYSWSALTRGLVALDPMAVMLVATAFLILTPVARVIVSIVVFASKGDRKFVGVTGIVFLVMVATVIFGLLGLR